ncbi:hypothetical protein PQX77_021201 [Marasmius sp. AFHP31]|nr:hypothetical protein PQX77_021201 [Marasmius sp. AFHP31]
MASIYVILFYASVTILCCREGSIKARSVLLVAIVLIFIISSFEVWTDVATVLTGIQKVFVNNVGTSFLVKQAAYGEQFSTVVSVQEALGPLEVGSALIVLGDLIVFWRVWALCAGQRKFICVPFAFLLGTVGMRFWSYRQNVGVYLSKSKKGRAEKLFILLVESGMVYSLLWIVQLVLARIPPPPTFAGQIVQQIFKSATVQLVGIYPTLLIVLVYLQRSLWDSSGNSTFVTLEGGSSAGNANVNDTDTSQTSLYKNRM